MPKLKISKSVQDRFKVTGSGKIMRRKIGQRHKHAAKRRTNLRRGKEPMVVTGKLEKKLKRLLGI
ncbi:MAG: 50S ribosomal protein L35 [Patescibacteria group bacterium]|nr:50S ribosomal protein L35 [Patescibacteria group bacterium]MCL5432064.1 50S ribosomal protein L35 [Patescibacteria group bacterium]